MTDQEVAQLTECAERAARYLIARGIPREEAIRLATEKVYEAARDLKAEAGLGVGWCGTGLHHHDDDDGMGQAEILAKAAADPRIKGVREAISPWLWVLSIIGFGLGLMNTRRIAKMFRDWRAKQKA